MLTGAKGVTDPGVRLHVRASPGALSTTPNRIDQNDCTSHNTFRARNTEGHISISRHKRKLHETRDVDGKVSKRGRAKRDNFFGFRTCWRSPNPILLAGLSAVFVSQQHLCARFGVYTPLVCTRDW